MRALLCGPGEEDPITQLEGAIQAGEVVGVKLYPPMGFRPSGNAPLADAFPALLRKIWEEEWDGAGWRAETAFSVLPSERGADHGALRGYQLP